MTESQRLAMEMNRKRIALTSAMDRKDESAMEGVKRELDDLTRRQLAAQELEYLGTPPQGEGERRELRALVERCDVTRILSAAVNGRQTDGPENELQRHLDATPDEIPWPMLAPAGVEHRADAATAAPATVQETQRPILQQVFARSALVSTLGVDMPAAGVGDELFQVITAGQAGEFAPASGTVDAAAGTITPKSLEPKRLTAAYVVRQEDTHRIRGYEPALREDLARTVSDRLDKQLIGLGDANQRGFLATAANGGIAARTAASNVVTYDLALAEEALGIDGLFAGGLNETNWLIGDDTARKLATLIQTGSGMTALAYAMSGFNRVQASANVPAPASDVQQGIICRRSGRQNAVVPVWGAGPRIIRDEITGAAEGEIRITILYFVALGILRSGAFQRTSLKLA